MKKAYIIIAALMVINFAAKAQLVKDSTSTGLGYSTQSFYSLTTGEIANVNNKNWDIAFSLQSRGKAGSAVMLNELTADLWAVPKDTSFWKNFDTIGHKNWKQLLNSDTTWDNGAYNKHRGNGPNGTFDMGWGYLDPSNNYWILGDSLYLCKLSDKSYRKVWIVSLKQSVWEFKYANIDGSNEKTITIKKDDYSAGNFIYYSMKDNKIEMREPTKDWDITFVGHKDQVAPGMIIPVVSVFSNRKVKTAKANLSTYSDAIKATKPVTAYTEKIDNIGREWKNFRRGKWSFYDSIAYFIYDTKGKDFYRLVFTKFGGSGTGKSYFDKEKIETISISTLTNNVGLSLYPNPAKKKFTLLINSQKSDAIIIRIFDLSGKLAKIQSMKITKGTNQQVININSLKKGMYFVNMKGKTFSNTQKLMVE